MTTLRFDIGKVQELAEHARGAPKNRMDFLQRAKIYGEDKMWEPQPDEQDRAEPGITIVKDHGIYLASTGLYPEGHERAEPNGRLLVAYANGFDPSTDSEVWHSAVAAVGGDDFSEPLPIEWVDIAVKEGAKSFGIRFNKRSITLVLPRRRA